MLASSIHNNTKPTVAVHKFSSCDGCQLAFLNAGTVLVELANLIDIVHFAEAGPINPEANVDIAFVEGSVSTPDELARIQRVRHNTRYLITIGACATSGGIQALRNHYDTSEWMASIYAKPAYIETLETATAISKHVKVDYQIWGCPINSTQVLSVIKSLLAGVSPNLQKDSVCVECKRHQYPCVMVTKGIPCMGPVTHMGCDALCPSIGRGCYACYGPSENPNTASLAKQFEQQGLSKKAVHDKFIYINSQAPAFAKAKSMLDS